MVKYSTDWRTINWGKYKGKNKSLPQIVLNDPDWFYYMYTNGRFNYSKIVQHQADVIARLARNIRIPKNEDGQLVIEYVFRFSFLFDDFHIIHRRDIGNNGGDAILDYKNVIDLSVPYRYGNYDKLGGRIMTSGVKELYFQGRPFTKQRCEEFFSSPENFVLRKGETTIDILPDYDYGMYRRG